VKTSLDKQEKHMSKVIQFPEVPKLAEVDKQFVEIERQQKLIQEQREKIEQLLKDNE
jgi:hypothetical protein